MDSLSPFVSHPSSSQCRDLIVYSLHTGESCPDLIWHLLNCLASCLREHPTFSLARCCIASRLRVEERLFESLSKEAERQNIIDDIQCIWGCQKIYRFLNAFPTPC